MNVRISGARLATLLADQSLTRPVYQSLAEAIRILIVDGRLSPRSILPSERELTDALGVSRTTVGRCYDLLREAGYAEARQGSGHVVTLPRGSALRSSQALFPADLFPAHSDALDLMCAGLRAPVGLANAVQQAAEALPGFLASAGYVTVGLAELREAIAQRYAQRGLPTSAEQIIITNGAVPAMATAIGAVLRRGDRAVVEHPSYPNTLGALRKAGVRITPAPMRGHGWDLDGLSAAISSGARAALLIPDFHNPTGALMDDAGREQVAASLARADAVGIIDETFCDLLLDPIQMPLPFAAHAPNAICVGGASKSFWGGLRIGWIRAPRAMIPALIESRMSVDPGASVLNQLVLAELLRPGLWPASGRLDELRASRSATLEALSDHLPELTVQVPSGGVLLWLDLGRPVASAVAVAAEEEGLRIASGPRFAVGTGLRNWIRLPYVLTPEQMREAVARLARALERVPTETADEPWRPLVA